MAHITTASAYHRRTSYERGNMDVHYLDWQNQPRVYKDFPGITPVSLPESGTGINKPVLSILKGSATCPSSGSLSLKDLSTILGLTYSLTAKTTHSGGTFYYRSAASAGALYPTEIYVQAHDVEGLDDGLYHFAILPHSLFPLRIDDLSGYTSGIISPGLSRVPILTFFFTAIFFRSAWKYRDRAYRYNLLDTGHVIENMLLALNSLDLPCQISYDYDDKKVNQLLGLDETREVSMAVVRIPGEKSVSDPVRETINYLTGDIGNGSIVSGREISYPAIGGIHRAGESVISGRYDHIPVTAGLGLAPDKWEHLEEPAPESDYTDYPDCLFKRRSSRNFINKPMDKQSLLALLMGLCSRDCDFSEESPIHHQAICTGFIACAVEGFSPGLYQLDNQKNRFGLITPGSFQDKMARACLDQAWLANAAVHFLFLCDLEQLGSIWGARGYRYAMMTAGRLGERIYIISTSLGIGCCGVGAFYDDETIQTLGLNKGIRLLYLVAAGPVKSPVK